MPQPFPWFVTLEDAEIWLIAFVFALNFIDVLAGLLQAVINNAWKSAKIREGIGHKAVIWLVMLLAVVIQGFAQHIGDTGWDVPLIYPVCILIAVMEVSSILENVSLAYPELASTGIFRLFDNATHKEDGNDA